MARSITYAALCLALLITMAGCRRGRHEFRPVTLPGPVYTWPAAARVVPSGSNILLRTSQDIRSERALPQEIFAAVVARDVLNQASEVLIPQGSPAGLMIYTAKGGDLELGLHSVIISGNTYLIGGSLPGSAGAPLGMLLDAVAQAPVTGPPVAISAHGSRIWVPALSLLTYRLNEPVRVEVSAVTK